MLATVTVHRSYRSARSGEVLPATTAASWARMLDELTALGLVPAPFSAADGTDGIKVACESQRGKSGAVSVHGLACRYGALAVID